MNSVYFMDPLVTLYQTFDTFEAELIKSKFESENLFCYVLTNDASGTLPHLGFAQGGTEILVWQSELETARKLLQQIHDNANSN